MGDQQLKDALRRRANLFEPYLQGGEQLHDAGEIRSLDVAKVYGQQASEGLLYVTDRRYVSWHNDGRTIVSYPYSTLDAVELGDADKREVGVFSQRKANKYFAPLTLNSDDGVATHLVGGRQFLSNAEAWFSRSGTPMPLSEFETTTFEVDRRGQTLWFQCTSCPYRTTRLYGFCSGCARRLDPESRQELAATIGVEAEAAEQAADQ